MAGFCGGFCVSAPARLSVRASVSLRWSLCCCLSGGVGARLGASVEGGGGGRDNKGCRAGALHQRSGAAPGGGGVRICHGKIGCRLSAVAWRVECCVRPGAPHRTAEPPVRRAVLLPVSVRDSGNGGGGVCWAVRETLGRVPALFQLLDLNTSEPNLPSAAACLPVL